MSTPVGRLVVELAASTAKFQADLARATASAEAASKRIGLAMTFIKSAVASIAGAVSVGAFVGLIKGSIDAADHLNDLSKATGVAVETLAGIAFAAQQSGSDLDGTAKAFGKLNLKIAEATAGNAEAAKVFQVLGISLEQLKTSSPDQIFARIADRFAEWEDGANKARIGQALFSKEYQSIIPLLDEGGAKLQQNIEYYKRYGTITKELAAQADEFNDTMVKLKLLNSAFANTLAAELLPNLQRLADHMVESKEKSGAFQTAAQDVAAVLKLTAVVAAAGATAFHILGNNIGASAAALVAFSHLDFQGVAAINEAFKEDTKRALEDLRGFASSLLGEGAKANSKPPVAAPKPRKPAPSFGSDDADAAFKKALDGRIAALDRYIKGEEDTLRARESFLQDYYQNDEIGLTDFFERRRAVLAEATRNTLAALDKEIQEYRAAEARLPKAADREDLENKIAKAIEKRTDVERNASIETYRSFREQQKAAQAFADSIEQISIHLAELNGDTVGAALAQFDFQQRELRNQIRENKTSTDSDIRRQAELGDRLLTNLRQRTAQQAQLTAQQRDFSRVMEEVSIAQESLSLKRASGQLTELDYLDQLSATNKSFIAGLEQRAAAYERIAIASNDPDALLQAKRLRLQIEQLAASTDLLADKFQTLFHDSFADAIASLADGTKTFSQAVKDMARSIEQSINKIASQNIADALFGKSGPGGGVGDLFAQIFRGNGGAGIGSFFANLFGSGGGAGASYGFTGISTIGGFAAGGDPPVGKISVVGERGPELFVPKIAGTVIPNDVLTSRRAQRQIVQHVNFYVQGQISTQTQDQLAAKMYAASIRARRIL